MPSFVCYLNSLDEDIHKVQFQYSRVMIPNTFTKFCQGFSHSTRMWDVVGWWMFPNNTILWCFTIGLRPATFLQQVYKPKCIESPLLVKIS